MTKANQYWQSHPRIRMCSLALARGEVIAYPTEAVWGLGCDPFNRHAVANVLSFKHRAANKGLILVAASMEQIAFLLSPLSDPQRALLEASWPGPVTWLLPHGGRIPRDVCGDSDKVAVRVSAHPVVQAICQRFGGPIVSTSANIQGQRPARTATDVARYFRGAELTIAPGLVGKNPRPSTIKDLVSGATLRE